MRTIRLLLVCIFAIVVVLGCQSEKKAKTENTETAPVQQTPVAAVEEITLSVSNMT